MPFPGTSQIPIAFSGGLQSKVARFSLDQPNLQDAKNVRYEQQGKLQKRNGFTALSRLVQGSGSIASGAAIATFGDELVLFDGAKVYSWSPDDEIWIPKGSAWSTSTSQIRIINTKIATQKNPDAATAYTADSSAGLTLFVWEDDRQPTAQSGVRFSIVDNATGLLVLADQLLWAIAQCPKVVPISIAAPNDTWLVTFQVTATEIYGVTISVARPNIVSTAFELVSNGASMPNPYDVCPVSGTDKTYVAFNSQVGLLLYKFTIAFGSATLIAEVATAIDVQVAAVATTAAGTVWLAWSTSSETSAESFTPTLTPLTSVTIQTVPSVNLGLVENPASPGTMVAVCEVSGAASSPSSVYVENAINVFQIAGFVPLPSFYMPSYLGQQRSVGLASKPFANDGSVFVNVVYPSSLQGTYFTLALSAPIGSGPNSVFGSTGATGFEIIAKHSPSNGGGLRNNTIMAECRPQYDPFTFVFAAQRKGAFVSFDDAQGVTLGCAGYTCGFGGPNEFNSVTSNNNLHITGGVKKIYDGVSVVEDNFHVIPELLSIPTGATFPTASPTPTNLAFAGNGCAVELVSGGNLENDAQYQYLVIYTWSDNFGQVQRSGTSVPTVVTTTAPSQAGKLWIPTLRLTDKNNPRTPVAIEIYRTQANLSIFFKVTSDSDPLVNDPTIDFVTFVDTLADGPPVNATTPNIAANENLYTGSQLANISPPGCSLISLFQNRIVINQSEDQDVVWYSQNKFDLSQYNTLALDWNTSFVEGIDSRGGGGVTALGLLDASLAIFKPTSIFLLTGSGPNPLDTSGEFNDAQLLVSDVGCTNQNSLVFVTQTPNYVGGLLFKSAKGIYLLGRDSSITYIGAPVERYNDLTITSASLLAMTNEIVFTTAEGTALVYNYYFDVWSTWQDLPAVDAVIWNDALVILRDDGVAMVQDLTGTVWQDTFNVDLPAPLVRPVTRIVKTPWIKLAGNLQGYQAVYNALILGQFEGNSELQVDVAYDYNPAIVESAIIGSSLAGPRWGSLPVWGQPAGTWANRAFANYQFQVNFKNPRCQSIQLTLTDLTPQATAGSTLDGLALEVLALKGGFRLPRSNLIKTSGYSK